MPDIVRARWTGFDIARILFLRTDALGVSQSSHLVSAAGSIFADGWSWLAAIVFLFVVVSSIASFAC